MINIFPLYQPVWHSQHCIYSRMIWKETLNSVNLGGLSDPGQYVKLAWEYMKRKSDLWVEKIEKYLFIKKKVLKHYFSI